MSAKLSYRAKKLSPALLEKIQLAQGAHDERNRRLCAMEAVAWLAGEPHSAAPACACPVLARYVIRLNDRWRDDERQLLKAYLPRLVGSKRDAPVERARGFVAADYAVRVIVPLALDAAKRPDIATKLRTIPAITDEASAVFARDRAREVRRAAAAAAAAAADAYADAAAAAYAAAYADADAAAAADAYADAAAAAYAAADAAAAADADAYADAAAAADAAADARKPIITASLDCLDAMLRVGEAAR